jgi:hypothetical protein
VRSRDAAGHAVDPVRLAAEALGPAGVDDDQLVESLRELGCLDRVARA